MFSSSSSLWTSMAYQFSWRRFLSIVIVVVTIHAASVSCSPPQISYHDHCSSVVPESLPTLRLSRSSAVLFPGTENGYCLGGDRILSGDSSESPGSFSKRLALRARNVYGTEDEGVFMAEGSVNLQSSNAYYNYGGDWEDGVSPASSWGGSVTFLLHGFWSESSGKLCMVGTGSAYSIEGQLLDLAAVLKLDNVKNMSSVRDLVNGTLQSLSSPNDPNYFEPISMVVFPQMNYKHTLATAAAAAAAAYVVPAALGLGFCSVLTRLDNWFQLEYPHGCNSSQDCTPFGGGIGYLPNFMSIKASQCTEDEQRLQVMIKFHQHNFNYFDPNMVLVGEGWWDSKNNRVSILGCRISNNQVGDCSIRLSLEFPVIWSIRSRNGCLGKIWSNKTVDDSGHFSTVMFRTPENMTMEIPGLKYEYTEIDRAGKLCQKRNPAEDNNGGRNPNPNPNRNRNRRESLDMEFDMEVKNINGVMGWGSAAPLFVGDNPYEYGNVVVHKGDAYEQISPVNVSYKISFTMEPGAEFGEDTRVDIPAEGIYDAMTGGLCMVGCRKLSSSARFSRNPSADCEVLVKFQFPPLGSRNGDHIRGSIESTRERSDPLYFNRLDLSSSSPTPSSLSSSSSSSSAQDEEKGIIVTMDQISSTLSCFLIGLQLLHVRKNPAVLPCISLVMLVVLNFSFVIPILEALLLGTFTDHKLTNLVMVAGFLLHFRVLRLTWSARLGHGKGKGKWVEAESNALFLSLPLYISGCLISFSLNQKNLRPSFWGALRFCSGLVLDWFLVPQILLNFFTDSREKAVSDAFHVGTTLIRLIPRAHEFYCLWLGRNYTGVSEILSAAWNAMVASASLIFGMALFLQQQPCSPCILPKSKLFVKKIMTV